MALVYVSKRIDNEHHSICKFQSFWINTQALDTNIYVYILLGSIVGNLLFIYLKSGLKENKK